MCWLKAQNKCVGRFSTVWKVIVLCSQIPRFLLIVIASTLGRRRPQLDSYSYCYSQPERITYYVRVSHLAQGQAQLVLSITLPIFQSSLDHTHYFDTCLVLSTTFDQARKKYGRAGSFSCLLITRCSILFFLLIELYHIWLHIRGSRYEYTYTEGRTQL